MRNSVYNQRLVMFRFNMIHVLVFLSFLFSSCNKFLGVDPPKSKMETDLVFGDDATATAAVLGVYVQMVMNTTFSCGDQTSVLALGGLSGDELSHVAKLDVSLIEFERNNVSAKNDYVVSSWMSMYKNIYQANANIEGIEASTRLSDPVRNQLLGESYFIRAFCYFYLVNMFGDVPLVLTTDYLVNSIASRTSTSVIYEKIVEDMQKSHSLLSSDYSYFINERNRPIKFAASAMLARVYLYLNNWEQAQAFATEVIEADQLYDLKDDLNEVFLKNSMEAIWQLSLTRPSDPRRGSTNEGAYFSPSRVAEYNLSNNTILKSFLPGDLRFDKWMNYIVVADDTLYFPYKYKQASSNATVTEYSMVLRLAEQYLIRAEARAMQNIVTGANSAASDLNFIRNRAGLKNTSATSKEEILEDIMNQRRVELMAEWGHRWFDLKRWKKANEILAPLKGATWQPTDTLYPLPQSEMNTNPYLRPQNPGYN